MVYIKCVAKCLKCIERDADRKDHLEEGKRLVGAEQVWDGDEMMLISNQGTAVRTRVEEVSVQGRNTQGVRVIRTREGEALVSVSRIAEDDIDTSVADTMASESAAGDDVVVDPVAADAASSDDAAVEGDEDTNE